jgi:hypothetical protein
MIRNEVFENGECISAEVIDFEAKTYATVEHGGIVEARDLTDDEFANYSLEYQLVLGRK